MRVFKYGHFIIRDGYQEKAFKVYLKNNETLYSQMSFSTPEIAAKVMRIILKAELKEFKITKKDMHPYLCRCGCGETFYKKYRHTQLFIKGHNARVQFKKAG